MRLFSHLATLIYNFVERWGGELSLLGLAKINLKIFSLFYPVWLFVISSCEHNIVLGLDLIKKFRLSQDHNLKISQDTLPNKSNNLFNGAGLPVNVQFEPAAARATAADAVNQPQRGLPFCNPVINSAVVVKSSSNTKNSCIMRAICDRRCCTRLGPGLRAT
jgi:hypothetical protein